MILTHLNNDKICFEELSSDSNSICILTRPIFEIEVDEKTFNSIIYTSTEIKSILTKKFNSVPEKFIVTIPLNQWTDVIKIEQDEYRLAGLDMGTVSLHFMILLENRTKNEIYLYTGDFFTIDKLIENDFFKEIAPKIKKIFFDNKTIKYDLNTHINIISTFMKQKIDNYSFAIYLPHLGYEDFLAALIKRFNITVHVNEVRKLLLQKVIGTTDGIFVDKDGDQPKLIVHRKSKSLNDVKKLYYRHQICSLSFTNLKEFSSETPKILDYYLTMLQWDQHPTEQMVLQLFGMLPQHIEFNLIYEYSPCPKAIIDHYVCTDNFLNPFELIVPDSMLSLDLSNINLVNESQTMFSQSSEFEPQFFSSQLPNHNQRPIPVSLPANDGIETMESSNLPNSNDNDEEVDVHFNIENYRDLDLGILFTNLRFIEKEKVVD